MKLGRDLRTLEREIAKKMDKKDEISAKVTSLNKELSRINDKISQCTNLSAEAEKSYREMQERFLKEQEMYDKRNQLVESIRKCQHEEQNVRMKFASMVLFEKVTYIYHTIYLNSSTYF